VRLRLQLNMTECERFWNTSLEDLRGSVRHREHKGDPYQRLLELSTLSDQELQRIVQGEKNCIFCDIIAHRREASRVYEDEYTVAFMNLRQANEGHVLVVPN